MWLSVHDGSNTSGLLKMYELNIKREDEVGMIEKMSLEWPQYLEPIAHDSTHTCTFNKNILFHKIQSCTILKKKSP